MGRQMRRVKGDKNLSSSASLGFDAAAVAASYGSHKHCRMDKGEDQIDQDKEESTMMTIRP